ncbi:PREDICTED: valacyclovir hydrolase isoform X2 [Capra hircus]|uniref:valacyclovir hydrolase isoform X2 n=1 Tax=Capra hircus TaxID=9925 RepID=UPI000847526B|nr:PREDICTED: valacyclovir hydrolase isoform X2 [Capra hircus]
MRPPRPSFAPTMAATLGGRAARQLRLLLSALKPGIQVPRAGPAAAFGSSVTSAKAEVNGVHLHYLRTGDGEHTVLLLPGMLGRLLTTEPAGKPRRYLSALCDFHPFKYPLFSTEVQCSFLQPESERRSVASDSATPCTIQSMEFSRPEYWSSGETDFGPQIEKLNKKLFTVVAWDPRGYGHSRPPDRDFPVDFFERDAKDAVDLMKTLKFKKVSLLGWSDGGITALIAAARYPSYVSKMVIWGANAYVTEQDTEIYQGIRDVSKWSERTRKPLEALYGFDYFARTCEKWVDGIEQFKHLPDGSICLDLLPLVQCPTLIVHGEKDPLVPRFHADFLHRHVRGSRFHLMPEGKHNLHLRFADEFNKLAEDFLQ